MVGKQQAFGQKTLTDSAQGQNQWGWRHLKSIGSSTLLILSLMANTFGGSAMAAPGKVSEASPPSGLVTLARKLDRYAPQVTIVSPKPDTVLQDNSVAVTFNVKDLPIFKDAKLGLGPHLHVVLDEDAYLPVYDLSAPLVLKDLKPGTHTIRAFASRPWHESFKNEGAFAQSTFHVLTRTQDDQPDPKLPLLTYSRPQGSYGAEPIMLDYYLTNAPLHIVAKDRTSVTDWRIKATVNGNTSFILDKWQPIYLKGFEPGKNWVQLEFVDPKGKAIANVYNNTVRVFDYQPGGDDALAKLVRGDLTAAAAMTIVDPNYVPPVAKPVEPPKVEAIKANELKADVKTPEVKKPEVKAEVKTPEVKTPEVKPAAKPEVKVNPVLVPIPIPMGRPKSVDQPINSIVPKQGVKVSPSRSQTNPEVKTPAKLEVKAPAKVEVKTPAKLEVKTPAKVEVKTPAKLEVKAPAKPVEVKTPAKVEIKPPAKVEVKSPEVEVPALKAPEGKASWFKLPSLPKAMPIPIPVGKPAVIPAIKAPEKPAVKVEVKTPAKVEIKPPAKVEVKTPARVEIKPPAKVEVKPPAKVEIKPPAKVEVKTPAKIETKAPIKLTPKAPAPAKMETKVPAKVAPKAPVKPIEVKPVAKPIAPIPTKAPAKVEPKIETKAPAKVESGSWLDRLRDALPKGDAVVPPVPAKAPSVKLPEPTKAPVVAPKAAPKPTAPPKVVAPKPEVKAPAAKPVVPAAKPAAIKPVVPVAKPAAIKPVVPVAKNPAIKPVVPAAKPAAVKPVVPAAKPPAAKPVAPQAKPAVVKPVVPAAKPATPAPVAPMTKPMAPMNKPVAPMTKAIAPPAKPAIPAMVKPATPTKPAIPAKPEAVKAEVKPEAKPAEQATNGDRYDYLKAYLNKK